MVLASGFVAPYVREADFAVRTPWTIGPRYIQDYLIIYVQFGEFAAYVEGREFPFQPGEICLIQPNVRHTIEGRTDTITPYAHFDLIYDPANSSFFPVRELDQPTSSPGMGRQPTLREMFDIDVPVTLRLQDPARFRDVLLRMIGTWQQDDVLSHLEANHMAMELALGILRSYGGNGSPLTGSSPESFGWITSYLSFHLSDPVSVTDMAKRAGLSVSRFSALFRQHFGCSPYRYLKRLRVLHAQDLLSDTDLTQEEIAKRSGFANAQHFSRVFRDQTGVTPGVYRSLNRHPPTS